MQWGDIPKSLCRVKAIPKAQTKRLRTNNAYLFNNSFFFMILSLFLQEVNAAFSHTKNHLQQQMTA